MLCKNKKKHSPKRESKPRPSDKQKQQAKADLWFSRYIRLKYHSNIIGGEVFCRCIITGIQYHANEMDNGHCISRDNILLRYNENNCRPEYAFVNRLEASNHDQLFRKNLIDQIGEHSFMELLRIKQQTGERSLLFYQEQANKWQDEVKRLLNKYNARKWWK